MGLHHEGSRVWCLLHIDPPNRTVVGLAVHPMQVSTIEQLPRLLAVLPSIGHAGVAAVHIPQLHIRVTLLTIRDRQQQLHHQLVGLPEFVLPGR